MTSITDSTNRLYERIVEHADRAWTTAEDLEGRSAQWGDRCYEEATRHRDKALRLRVLAALSLLLEPEGVSASEITAVIRESLANLYSKSDDNVRAYSSVFVPPSRSESGLSGLALTSGESLFNLASALATVPLEVVIKSEPEAADYEIGPAEWRDASRLLFLLADVFSADEHSAEAT